MTILALVFLFACKEKQSEADLKDIDFYLGSESVALTGDAITLDVHDLEIYDVEYHKDKSYQAFLFDDVLKAVFGQEVSSDRWNSVSFVALDGYNAVIDKDFFGQGDAFLIFHDKEYPEWEAIPDHGNETAAPYYLVWTEKEKIPQNGYSWPWGISEIALVNMAEEYTHATPDSGNVSTEVFAGYKLFMRRCNSCHSLGGQGGYIGPDLNEPMNILEYRTEEMVRMFITEPSSFRRGRMPDFKDLTSTEVDQLIGYLTYLKDEKNAPS